MGEYAIRAHDGAEIKIGTCESMYYLRLEDKRKVTLLPGQEFGHFWRIPFPDEDAILPGNYNNHNRGERLVRPTPGPRPECAPPSWDDFSDPSTIEDPGIIQLSHENGLLVNVPCYHGEKLPEGSKDIKCFWNGKSHSYELAHLRTTAQGVFPVVRCRHCGHMWRYQWPEILPYIQNAELKKRLEKYVGQPTKEA